CRSPPPPPPPKADLPDRHAQAARLHEIVERARFEPAQLLLLGAVHRGEHDPIGTRTLPLQGGEDRVSVQGGKIDVEEQQRMRAPHVEREQLAQRIPPVAIRQEPVPMRAQPVLEQLGERRVVLHIDHFRHVQGVARRDGRRCRFGGNRRRGSCGRRGRRGRSGHRGRGGRGGHGGGGGGGRDGRLARGGGGGRGGEPIRGMDGSPAAAGTSTPSISASRLTNQPASEPRSTSLSSGWATQSFTVASIPAARRDASMKPYEPADPWTLWISRRSASSASRSALRAAMRWASPASTPSWE